MWNLQKNVCLMCMEKHVLVKKMFTNELNMGWNMFIDGLNCLKKSKQHSKWRQARQAHNSKHTWNGGLSKCTHISVDKRDTIENISEQIEIFIVQHTKLGMMTFPFLRSDVIGFHQDNARILETSVNLVGNSCQIVLTVFIWTPLISTGLASQRISTGNKVFTWW